MTTRANPLLLLHTWGGDAATWGPAVRHLGADGRHLKALDLPGHGARGAEPFTVDGAVDTALSAYAEGSEDTTGSGDSVRPVDTTGPENATGPVDAVGSGLGALVALALAQRHPDRVRSLTLVGFPPAGGAEAARRPADTRAALERDGAAIFARNYVDSTLLSADPAHRDLLRGSMAGTRPEVLIDSLRATLGWTEHTGPGPLGLPCLVLRGARDHRVPAAAAEALAERLGGRGAVVPGAGHVAYLDEPEAFADALTAFHDGLRTVPAD